MINSKKILVTGGNGFIGSNFIVDILLNNNIVLNIDANYEGAVDPKFRFWEKDKNYSEILDDINNLNIKSIIMNFKPDLIYHFAAESHVDKSIEDPIKCFNSNLMSTLKLLEALRKSNLATTFFYISTDEVFGSAHTGFTFSENSCLRPSSPYSASKAAAELAVQAWCATYGISYIITNCTNNYGEFQHKDKLIPKFINCLKNNINFPLYGNGLNVRDWMYVKDHINALHHIEENCPKNQSYCIGTKNEHSNINILNDILKIHNSKKNLNLQLNDVVKFTQDRPGHDFRYSVSTKKIQESGWESKYTYKESLITTYDWHFNG